MWLNSYSICVSIHGNVGFTKSIADSTVKRAKYARWIEMAVDEAPY